MTGLYNIDKPAGMTSAGVVARIKRITGERRVGHMGTLDPQGTGVLLVGMGRGTRLFDLLLNGDKTYSADFTFGYETDTFDGDGKETGRTGRIPSTVEILMALPAFVGKLSQIPPAYSAKSIGGVKSYKLAREGKPVELKPSEVEVFSFLHDGTVDARTHRFLITCSSGTYVRSLCRDLADALGTVAVMTAIRRLRVGRFEAANSVTIEDVERDAGKHLLPITAALADLPKYEFGAEKFRLLQNGVRIYADAPLLDSAIYCCGELFGVGKSVDGALNLSVNLYEPKI